MRLSSRHYDIAVTAVIIAFLLISNTMLRSSQQRSTTAIDYATFYWATSLI
jgi:hypothetical protein